MKKILFIFCSLISVICLCSFSKVSAPLDVIEEYDITVNPKDDGTLDIRYHIRWKVLNSKKEGPLSWVKIGVPNKRVDNLTYYSSNIKDIKYSSNGGSFVRIDFDRKYYANEIVDFEFSIHQDYIFTIDNNQVCYSFIPGWFDEIEVQKITVLWEKDNTIFSNHNVGSIVNKDNKDYYKWEYSLSYGDTIEVNLKYDKSSFPNIDITKTYDKAESSISKTTAIIFLIVIVVVMILLILICIIISAKNANPYNRYRGFCRYRSYGIFGRTYIGVNSRGKPFNPSIVNRGSSGYGGSCACACACACAGGGRAGCSRKDFYNPKVNIDDLVKEIENN